MVARVRKVVTDKDKNMQQAEYIVEKHKRGWLIKSARSEGGIPIDALQEILPLLPKKSELHPGIANHCEAVLCLGAKKELDAWENEIEKSLEKAEPQIRFLLGTKGGCSSWTMFIALTKDDMWRAAAEQKLRGDAYTPQDTADFSRCVYLLNLMPEWRARIAEVGDKFPNTAWPKMAEKWFTIESLIEHGEIDEANALLRAINGESK